MKYVNDASQVIFCLLGLVLLAATVKVFFIDKKRP